MSSRVVITGIGLVTPIGIGVDAFWRSCLAGVSGVGRIRAFNPSDYPTQIAAELQDFDPLDAIPLDFPKDLERVHQLGLVAAALAIADSGLDTGNMDCPDISVCGGSCLGSRLVSEERLTAIYHYENGRKKVPLPQAKTVSDFIADQYGIQGPILSFSNACASGNHSIGWAFNLLRLGKAEIVIAGGAEAPVLPLTTAGFCAMRAMSRRNDNPQRASRPFDRDRDGFVLGEGAGFMVLESLESARRRGAQIYAEIAGYSMTCEAYHMALPEPTAGEVAQAMEVAVRDAGVDLANISYINAHGTSTPKNDAGETMAIKALFGDQAYRIPISATKSMIGHTLGAAGAVEVAACALSVRNDALHPTINYEFPDSECDLDYVPNEARQYKVNVAISNSFGFGGNNSSIVLKKLN